MCKELAFLPQGLITPFFVLLVSPLSFFFFTLFSSLHRSLCYQLSSLSPLPPITSSSSSYYHQQAPFCYSPYPPYSSYPNQAFVCSIQLQAPPYSTFCPFTPSASLPPPPCSPTTSVPLNNYIPHGNQPHHPQLSAMPSRNSGPTLPLFSTAGVSAMASRTILLPRSCLSPRMFLTVIIAVFCLSSIMLYSYSSFSLRFNHATSDSEDWTILEQRLGGAASRTMRWRNTTLVSHVTCQSSAAAPSTHGPSTPSIHGSGFNRETICTVQNLCVDAERGEVHKGVCPRDMNASMVT